MVMMVVGIADTLMAAGIAITSNLIPTVVNSAFTVSGFASTI